MDPTALPEIYRLLNNLIRLGTVTEVDGPSARVRVSSGNLLTDGLPWLAPRAGGARVWSAPTVGEQCVVLCPGGNPACGIVLLGLFSDEAPAPSDDLSKHLIQFGDGATVQYDEAAHALAAVLPAGGAASIDAPGGIRLKGAVSIEGGLAVAGDVAVDGDADVSGTVSADQDVVVAGVGVKLHSHMVTSPGSPSGPPQAGDA
ncbi:phage baseplate assembly protein V [Leptospira sp. 96542]|nr:phage baseplate assembly protein V [Leptospira sp. 96542]